MEQTTNQPTPLGVDNIEDDDGVKLSDEIRKAFNAVEKHIQEFIAENPGQVPDKVYQVNVGIQVAAEGLYSRRVVWEVEAKMPKLTKKHVQLARAKDGLIVAKRGAGQQRIPVEAMEGVGEKPDEDDADVHQMPPLSQAQGQ